MGQPYVGEIKLFAGNFAPLGYASCDGQLLAISENDVLFQLIGTTFGGDGQTNFALPDMRGRLPVHQGPNYVLGQVGGQESVTLTSNQIPSHNHNLVAGAGGAKLSSPANAMLGSGGPQLYASNRVAASGTLQNGLSPTGGNLPHENMMPFTTLMFVISLYGIFPPQA